MHGKRSRIRRQVMNKDLMPACECLHRMKGQGYHDLRVSYAQVMNEEILPACERLRREKGQYMEWQAESAKLDSLRRFCIAHRYVQAQR